MTSPAARALSLVAIGAFAVAGCAQNVRGPAAPAAHSAQTVPSEAAPTSPAAAATTSAAPAPPPLDDDGPTEAASPATPDPASGEQALVRATGFMRAFARTELPQQQWWAGVAGYFTPAAQPVYESTDVANVPVHRVDEGSAKLLPGTTTYRAQVAVATDDGTYTVVLIRADGQWLVDRATPPRS